MPSCTVVSASSGYTKEDYLVRHLIPEYPNAQHQQQQAISKHPLQQFLVQHISEARAIRVSIMVEVAYKVEEESTAHVIAFHPDVINQVQGYVQEDEQQFERRKPLGRFL